MSGLDATVASGSPMMFATEVSGVREIEVFETLGEPTAYRVRLDAPVVDGDIPSLADPLVDPGCCISIKASGQVLVNGPVTRHRIHLSGDDETSSLDVFGGDRLLEMGREARIKAWSATTASGAVSAIFGTYQFTPDVESTTTTFDDSTSTLVQRGTDLDFVRRIAKANGFVMWMSYDPIGTETAHLRRPPTTGMGTSTLDLHLPNAALDQVTIEWNSDRPTSVTAAGLDTSTLSTIDASVPQTPLAPLAGLSLAAITDGPRSAVAIAPGHDLASLSAVGNALLTKADLFVRASTATTAARAGTVVRAHTLVTLDGVGSRHSGTWLVESVRHLIDAVAHRMDITLVRNGWEA